MRSKTLKINPQDPRHDLILQAARIIQNGGVIAFPTRYLYGLGADAFNNTAVDRVFAIKRRPYNKPLLVLLDKQENLTRLVRQVPSSAGRIMESFWPGEVTVVFEAKEKGSVVLTGSEIWTDWQKTENPNIYIHHWPFKWGFTTAPSSWEGHVKLKPIVQRREMVFVNGTSLTQVLALSELNMQLGTFFIDEANEKIFISVPEKFPPSSRIIEVAVHSSIFSIYNKPAVKNIDIYTLYFQYLFYDRK